jgi:hypothetical protein
MQLPPKEKRGLWHDGIYVPEIPFKEYVDKKRKELAED